MRFIVLGTGAVGGVVGGRLREHGHDVVFIAREPQATALRSLGLRIESPETTKVLRDLVVVDRPSQIQWNSDDVVLLTVKTQHTAAALADLAAVAPDVPVVSIQNGVENERLASRWFRHVYGVCVLCPSGYVTPGVVQAWSSPLTGILDIGRYPLGADDFAQQVAVALNSSSFRSEVRARIMPWKYGKLLMNVANAAEALCKRDSRQGPVAEFAREEAVACFTAAGIEYVSEEDIMRQHSNLRFGSIAGRPRVGGSSWQSLQRQTGSVEADYLNGEIAMLGAVSGAAGRITDILLTSGSL